MKVFVFGDGERSEGHSPRSVHATLAGAMSAADSQWERDLSPDWRAVEDGVWKADVGACDEAWIYEMEVQP